MGLLGWYKIAMCVEAIKQQKTLFCISQSKTGENSLQFSLYCSLYFISNNTVLVYSCLAQGEKKTGNSTWKYDTCILKIMLTINTETYTVHMSTRGIHINTLSI